MNTLKTCVLYYMCVINHTTEVLKNLKFKQMGMCTIILENNSKSDW